jgi:hypothetical protein
MPPISIWIRPRGLLIGFVVGIVVLVGLDLVANLYLQVKPGLDTVALTQLFLFDAAGSIPSYAASALLGLSALILILGGLGARHQGLPRAGRWLLLGAIFAYLSLDQVVPIHERWDELIGRLAGSADGATTWVVVAGAILVASSVLWLPLIRSQSVRVRALWILAAGLFVGGALGSRVLGGPHQPPETATLGSMLIVAAENALELLGAAVFLYSLLVGLKSTARGSEAVRVNIGPWRDRKGEAAPPVDEATPPLEEIAPPLD